MIATHPEIIIVIVEAAGRDDVILIGFVPGLLTWLFGPEPPVPDVADVSSSHHPQFDIALGYRGQLQQLRLAPSAHEFAMLGCSVTVCREGKSTDGESLIDVEDQLDVAALHEVEYRLTAHPFNFRHFVEGRVGIHVQHLATMMLSKLSGRFTLQTGGAPKHLHPQD